MKKIIILGIIIVLIISLFELFKNEYFELFKNEYNVSTNNNEIQVECDPQQNLNNYLYIYEHEITDFYNSLLYYNDKFFEIATNEDTYKKYSWNRFYCLTNEYSISRNKRCAEWNKK